LYEHPDTRAKKKPLPASGLITVFIFLDVSIRPLSTPLPPADNNDAADEYQNKENNVAKGDNFVHGHCIRLF
jgi:hypothetical protein